MDDKAAGNQDSLVAKMLYLFDQAGFSEMIQPRDVVAIKLHMGEWNNTGYLRPVYIRALADKIKSLGGVPFVTDTTTLPYHVWAARVTALDYLTTAERNGFNSGTVGCPVIIADGYFGTDDVHVDLPEGVILKESYVATAIAAADALIVLSHFKGHGLGVVGGAIKNMALGCASKRGKFAVHGCGSLKFGYQGAPLVAELCTGRDCPNWRLCDEVCPFDALHVAEEGLVWEAEKCRSCMAHRSVVGCGALAVPDDLTDANCVAIADAARATQKVVGPDRVGCINLAIDITSWCDCAGFAGRPIIPNLGVFVSPDPVAVDMACIDAANAAPGIPGSDAEQYGVMECGVPKFSTCSSVIGVSQLLQLKTGQKNGLGSMEYELERIDQVESVLPYLFNPGPGDPVPLGTRFKRLFEKLPVFPSEGYRRREDVDLEELR
jgi:uncharacterized Fe-S center protein